MAFRVLIPRTVASEGIDYLEANACEVDGRDEMNAEELEAAIRIMMRSCSERISWTRKSSDSLTA